MSLNCRIPTLPQGLWSNKMPRRCICTKDLRNISLRHAGSSGCPGPHPSSRKCRLNFPSCLSFQASYTRCVRAVVHRDTLGAGKGFWSGVCSLSSHANPLAGLSARAFPTSFFRQQASPSDWQTGHLEREGCSVHYLSCSSAQLGLPETGRYLKLLRESH